MHAQCTGAAAGLTDCLTGARTLHLTHCRTVHGCEDSSGRRDYEPAVGQWYENVEEDETFRVIAVDEDAELVEIEYLDGDIEELDMDTWHEIDLEKIEQPEGWSGADARRRRG